MIKGIDAVVLIVKDLEGQKRFYRDVLGLALEADYGDAVFFTCGAQKIALFGKGHHPEGDKRVEGGKGISHLEFRIDAESLAAIDAKLRESGFHAYKDNYQDADGNLFHFNVE